MSTSKSNHRDLRIGVSGHRVLTDLPRLTEGVDTALKRIRETFPGTHRAIVSSLAEGADRLVLERARNLGFDGLVVPLPMTKDEYMKDFASPGSKNEFLELLQGAELVIEAPHVQSRTAGYAAAGRAILDHCDVLVAVWDGQASQGDAGTGDVVAEARERGIPIAWVHAGNRHPGTTHPRSLGEDQGTVTFERFPESLADAGVSPVLQDCMGRIHKALVDRDNSALAYQRKRLNFARFVIPLGPVAVLLLAIQILLFPSGGDAATALILTELAALTAALAVGFLEMGQSHNLWIRERLRTEALRRELFLLRARVGPYLTTRDAQLQERVQERLMILDNDLNDPVDLISLEESGESWLEALEERRGARALISVPEMKTCVAAYLSERIAYQRQWFAKKGLEHARRARIYENGAKIVLIIALIAAALHLGLLLAGERIKSDRVHQLAIFVAIVAPAVGSAFVAFQSVSGSHRLTRSYTLRARKLERLEGMLRNLQSRFERGSSTDDHLQFRFRRAVLEAEEVLSGELLQWWLIMHSEAPKAAS